MDPVGIGLGATSLAIQLFASCIKGYQLFLDAADMPEEFQHLQTRMRLEQIRLLNWGDKIGLLQENFEAPSVVLRLHHNLIFDILSHISHLFQACVKVQNKFSTAMTTSDSDQDGSNLISALSIYGPRTTTLSTKVAGILRRTSELPKRLEWAMIKREKFEDLIEQLISYNTSMLSLLDRTSVDQINQTQMQSKLTLLQLSKDVESLKCLVQAVEIQPSVSALHQIQALPPIENELDDSSGRQMDLGRLAMFKADLLSSERAETRMNDSLISLEDVQILKSTSRVDIAMFQDAKVWLEWKEFDQHNLNPWYQDMLETRVKQLAVLLSIYDTPSQFRGPACLGYVRETEDDYIRYGFVYRAPAHTGIDATPKTLLDRIKNKSSPSLTIRIKLAALLASSLLHLHAVNWLHKGFRSDNIFFFPGPDGEVVYKLPIISGFEFSRPDEPGEMTEKPQSKLEYDMYCHPQSIEQPWARSRKSWDIYGLGIVLAEIAAWKSIDKLVEIDMKAPKVKSRMRRIRETVLQDQYLDTIKANCGDQYCEVVRRCLTGGQAIGITIDADESDPEIAAKMIRAFSQDIVDVLAGIRI